MPRYTILRDTYYNKIEGEKGEKMEEIGEFLYRFSWNTKNIEE